MATTVPSRHKEQQRLLAHHRLVARRRCLVNEQREPSRQLLRAVRLGMQQPPALADEE
jgi:hypothetical protein